MSILASAAGGLWYRADVNRQHEIVNRRVEGARNQVRKFVESGQEAVRREDWEKCTDSIEHRAPLAHSELPVGRCVK